MVYLLDRDDRVGDIMRCFELSAGKEIWNFSYKAPGSVTYPNATLRSGFYPPHTLVKVRQNQHLIELDRLR